MEQDQQLGYVAPINDSYFFLFLSEIPRSTVRVYIYTEGHLH